MFQKMNFLDAVQLFVSHYKKYIFCSLKVHLICRKYCVENRTKVNEKNTKSKSDLLGESNPRDAGKKVCFESFSEHL